MFVGQIVGKWTEGGWVVLITFSILVVAANLMLLSPIGYREPRQIHRIVRDKARVQGAMASIVEWQSLKMQEYRYQVMFAVARFFATLGVIKPQRYEKPVSAGEFEEALNHQGPETFLDQYLASKPKREPTIGGAPKETAPGDEEGNTE